MKCSSRVRRQRSVIALLPTNERRASIVGRMILRDIRSVTKTLYQRGTGVPVSMIVHDVY